MSFLQQKVLAVVLYCSLAQALTTPLDVNNPSSVQSASHDAAGGLVNLALLGQPNTIPGILPSSNIQGPNETFWYEGGVVMNSLINYWGRTRDSQYNEIVSQALEFQKGSNNDYQPSNQSASISNDDQATWALAAMSGAEQGLMSSGSTSWSQLAENVFNTQVLRWDTETCGGGLRWQVNSFNSGYNYKNSMSQGYFFELAARLARFTGNQTYSDWATKSYDWTSSIGLIDMNFNVYDGTSTSQNCSTINKLQWSYEAATFMYGSALMWNMTSSDIWKTRTQGFASSMKMFFPSGIMTESACESVGTCLEDEKLFKGIAALSIAQTMAVAPFTTTTFMSDLRSTAAAAGKACSGSGQTTACASQWANNTGSTTSSIEGMVDVLNILTANLPSNSKLETQSTSPAANSSTLSDSQANSSDGSVQASPSSSSATARSTNASNRGAEVKASVLAFAVALTLSYAVRS